MCEKGTGKEVKDRKEESEYSKSEEEGGGEEETGIGTMQGGVPGKAEKRGEFMTERRNEKTRATEMGKRNRGAEIKEDNRGMKENNKE